MNHVNPDNAEPHQRHSSLLSATEKLDKFDAPPYQVGVQFFQVGNEEGAKEALEELDDGLSELVEGGVRDTIPLLGQAEVARAKVALV